MKYNSYHSGPLRTPSFGRKEYIRFTGPENVQMININLIGQSILDIRYKSQKTEGGRLKKIKVTVEMNPSQLVDVDYKVNNDWEIKKAKDTNIFIPVMDFGAKTRVREVKVY
jgi:hypothetical protein